MTGWSWPVDKRLVQPAPRFKSLFKSGEVVSASGKRRSRIDWGACGRNARLILTAKAGPFGNFSSCAMRHIFEKQRRPLRLVADHRADFLMGRGMTGPGAETRKRPISDAQATMMHERFARRRKIAAYADDAPNGGGCVAETASKRVDPHVRTPCPYGGIGPLSSP